jgi:hypothetical protein
VAETPPPAAPPAPEPEQRGWRKHPLAKRLPLLLLAAFGFWLWRTTETPERELRLQFDGPGWSAARALDFQVLEPDSEQIVKRAERFYPSGPPPEETFGLDLPEGTWRVRLFVKVEGHERRLKLEQSLEVDEQRYIVRQLQMPPTGR